MISAAIAEPATRNLMGHRLSTVLNLGRLGCQDSPYVQQIRTPGMYRAISKVFFIGRNSRKFPKFPFYP